MLEGVLSVINTALSGERLVFALKNSMDLFMKILNTIAIFSIFSVSLQAAETDQFYAARAVIRDSSKEMNAFFYEKIEEGLNIVNQKKKTISCRAAAFEVLTQVLGEFNLIDYAKNKSFSKISSFTQKSPLIDRYPDDSISKKEYRSNSIYKNRPFPVNVVGVASTLNLNGIYMGTDKMGHFSIVGRTYYKHFLEELEKGLSEDQAQEIAIQKGFKQEEAILGYKIGGTFSYGDLEANYQGLVFARNMCEGETPYLVKEKSMWSNNPSHHFDIRVYINRRDDEAYNVSFWSPRMWRKMKGEIITAYCKNKEEPDYQARVEYYNRILKPSLNDVMIVKFLKENPKFDRANQLLSKDIDCSK